MTQSVPKYIPESSESLYLLKDMYKSFHSGFIQNSPPPGNNPDIHQQENK